MEIATRAIDIFRRLIFEDGRSDLLRLLGLTCLNRGQFYKRLGDIDAAEKDYGLGRDVWLWLLQQRPSMEAARYGWVAAFGVGCFREVV